MKIKKPMFLFLLPVAVILIWLFNLSRLVQIHEQNSKSDSLSIAALLSSDSAKRDYFDFTPLMNNPFNVVPKTINKEPVMPTLTLKGIVVTNNGALALMESANGNVHPLRRGEEFQGVKVMRITAKEVTVVFNGQKQVYSLLQ